MTITFENDNDVIVYALEKIIAFARLNQYLFLANCVWWIAGVTGLERGLTVYINNLESRRQISVPEISATPRDIARNVNAELEQSSDEFLPRSNPSNTSRNIQSAEEQAPSQIKRQRKKARRQRKKARQVTAKKILNKR